MTMGCNSSDCPSYDECDRAYPNTLMGNYTYFPPVGKQECSSFIPIEEEISNEQNHVG